MDQPNKADAKRAKLQCKELHKLAEKIEKHCFPLQSILVRIANAAPDANTTQRVDTLNSKLSMVMAGLHQVQESTFKRGGGASERNITRLISKAGTGTSQAQQNPDSQPKPTLNGKSPDFSLSSVLDFISKQGKSGSLTIALDDEEITFGILEGDIVYASTNRSVRGERLGEILIERNEVSQQHFMAFVDAHRSDGQMLGMSLVNENIVSQDALTAALVEQMQRRFDRVFGAETCSFSFFEGKVSPNTGLNINVVELLIESGQAAPPTPMGAQSDEGSTWGAPSKAARGWQGTGSSDWNDPRKL